MKFLLLLIFFASNFIIYGIDNSDPYQLDKPFVYKNYIDKLLLDSWEKQNIKPAKTSSDAVFLRRVYIDLIGTIPTINESRKFLADKNIDKRSNLIDQLLERKEFAQYWSLKWCDILRVKSEFPINLWPNAVQAYNYWIWEAIQNNMPYDKFARKLLTSSGSNFRDPPVNFYRALQDKTPLGFAKVAALTFMGTRLNSWSESNRKEFEKLFSRIGRKRTDEWKEEIIYLNPAPVDDISATMPDGTILKISQNQDPRIVFADWLIRPDNRWFTQAAVNRVWFWFFNRGIVHEPDDFKPTKHIFGGLFSFLGGSKKQLNKGNPASNPELLDYLATYFVKSGYDFKKLCRLITNSATYQQSCIPAGGIEKADKYFAVYPIRRLDAEVLIDALSYLGNVQPKYMSVIPEPFTYIPRELRTITLSDGSISSSFLETFGRPARDSGLLMERNNQTTYSQRLFLLNSPIVLWKVSNSQKMKNILREAKWKPEKIVNGIYLLILSRNATEKEYKTIVATYNELFKPSSKKGNKKISKKERKKENKKRGKRIYQMASGLLWTLVNSKEFLFQH